MSICLANWKDLELIFCQHQGLLWATLILTLSNFFICFQIFTKFRSWKKLSYQIYTDAQNIQQIGRSKELSIMQLGINTLRFRSSKGCTSIARYVSTSSAVIRQFGCFAPVNINSLRRRFYDKSRNNNDRKISQITTRRVPSM